MRGRPRRVKGEGSIYQRKDGRWGASVWTTVGGKKKRRSIAYKDRDRLLAEMRKIQAQGAASGKGTFGEWLTEWLKEVKTSARPKTYESYEAIVRLRLIPQVGAVKLAKLEARHINEAVTDAREAGLSTSTCAYVRNVARIALNRAIRLGKVTVNAAAMAAPVTVERTEYEPFTDAEFIAFIAGIAGDRFEAAYLLAVLVGPRIGEILGLKWSDRSERDNPDGTTSTLLSITRQVQRVNGRLTISPPKSKKSRRVVVLPPEVAEAFSRRKTAQLEDRMKAGHEWVDNGHIFTTRKGTLMEPRNLLDDFYAILAKAGIKRRPFHGLRHEAATALLAAGVPLKAITAQHGHANERFLSERYAHMVPALEAQLTAAASARLKAGRKK